MNVDSVNAGTGAIVGGAGGTLLGSGIAGGIIGFMGW